MPYAQDNRQLAVDTVLGPAALLVTGLSGREEMSRPFGLTLDLTSEDPAVEAAAVLGTPACVRITLPDGGERYIHGIVNRFRKVGAGTALASYQAEVVPWLWMLSLSTDCRIFQELSVPEIVGQVFRDLGYSDFRFRLVKSYAPREFCVQYRETHLAFVSRLLEDEGIFYYFEHSADQHMLVLADSLGMLSPCPELPTLRSATTTDPRWREDVYTELAVESALHTRAVTLADYNYLAPSVSLEASLAAEHGAGEAFDYPGGYGKPDEGSRYAQLRLETAEAQREAANGASGAAALTSGHTVELHGDTPPGSSGTWLVVAVEHTARQGSFVARGRRSGRG
jgi:type VI secretion system secreted protein VgrG